MKRDEFNLEGDLRLKSALEGWRADAIVTGERPEGFWVHQCRTILDRAKKQKPAVAFRPLLVWGTVAAVIIATSLLVIHRPRPVPASDFAAGYDLDLLLDVERLTSAQMPFAFEPAALLTTEIQANKSVPRASLPEEQRR